MNDKPRSLTAFIDRMAREYYEELDSHYTMSNGLSWEEYKADDPQGAEVLYLAPMRRAVAKAARFLPPLDERAELIAALVTEAERRHAAFAAEEAEVREQMRERFRDLITDGPLTPGHDLGHDDGCSTCGFAAAARFLEETTS